MARRPGSISRIGQRADRPVRLDPGVITAPRRPKPAPEAPPPSADPTLVRMGEFGRAQGLNGEVRLKSYTGDPSAIASYGPLIGADGRRIALTSVRPIAGDMLVARVEGVSDRTGAEALNRLALFLPRERLGEAADEDEFFAADLVGLAVVDKEGTPLGTITDVPNYGGGDLLEIRPAAGGATALLPFTKAFVPSLDLANGRVVVDPPADLFAPPGPKPADEPD